MEIDNRFCTGLGLFLLVDCIFNNKRSYFPLEMGRKLNLLLQVSLMLSSGRQLRYSYSCGFLYGLL